MTYNIEEFKAWLIAHNRLNAWTTPVPFFESLKAVALDPSKVY